MRSDTAPRLTVRPVFQELGSPLLLPESFERHARTSLDSLADGEIVELVNAAGRFVGRGYIGRQNKGVGWLLTTKPQERIDAPFFTRKIGLALEKRLSILQNPKTTAFRVFHGEGDGIGGLTIDYYDESYLITYYSAGIAHYAELILSALLSLTQARAVVEKRRFSDHDPSGVLVHGERNATKQVILENGVRLHTDLLDGAMTGIFLDQRDVRRALRNQWARGKRVLNLFSYSGAFSVFAAKGGARATVSVDAAPRSLELTAANFALNDLPFGAGTAHTMLVTDVFDYLGSPAIDERFDVIVLDPPSFSTVRGKAFRSEKDYGRLVELGMRRLRKGGTLLLSTNNAQISHEKFERKVAEGIGGAYRVLERFGLPKDFRTHPKYTEGEYLKVLIVQPDV